MFSTDDVGSTLKAAREEAGVGLTEWAGELFVSVGHLSNIEAGRRSPSLAIVKAYDDRFGPIGDEMLRRRDITHPGVMKADKPTLTQLARQIDGGDPGVLKTHPSSRTVDFFLAAKLADSGLDHVREWVRTGETATLRANALAVLSKVNEKRDAELIIEALETDEKLQFLSLASEVSKLTQWDWETSKRVAKNPSQAPEARKLAKALTKEALLKDDVESRWCGAFLLKGLVPAL